MFRLFLVRPSSGWIHLLEELYYNTIQYNTITPQKHIPNHTARQQWTQTPKHKRATFTYTGKETLYIINVFKRTDLKIAFRTNNTIENLLRQRYPISDKFSSYGVYKLTCPDCHKAYVGQTGRQFYTRYKEHRSAFYHSTRVANFAQTPPWKAHSFGPTDIMQVLRHQKKGAHSKNSIFTLSKRQATIWTMAILSFPTESLTPS